MGASGRNVSKSSLESMGGHRLDAHLQRKIILVRGAKVGATVGWVVAAADNLGLMATLPASQTASTLVVPFPNLRVGDTIRSFHLIGQVESAGQTVTIDAALRKITAAAADVVDAAVASMTQLALTADAILSATNTEKTLSEVVVDGVTYYFLITVTNGSATDIALQGLGVVSY